MIYVVVAGMLVYFFVWPRFAPVNAEKWHVDPETVQKTRRPNQYLVRDGADAQSPVFDMPASAVFDHFDKIARQKPNVTLVAGDPATGWATYEQRSKKVQYPDYISVRATDLEDGRSKLSIYSRSRFGRSDLGVNEARVTNWLAALGQAVTR